MVYNVRIPYAGDAPIPLAPEAIVAMKAIRQ
jgi:hypothetical protein